MGEQFPNNSDAAKAEKKNIVPVVAPGKAKIRKKSNLQKMTEGFIENDAQSIASYVVSDVIVPKTKDLLHDIGMSALDMLFYGSVQSYRNSGATRRPGAARPSYTSYYASDNRPQQPKPKASRDPAEAFAYDDVVFPTRLDAERVIDKMMDILGTYPSVSVADFYESAGMGNDNYTLNNYGWTDLSGAETIPVRDGYIVKFPRPRVLASR